MLRQSKCTKKKKIYIFWGITLCFWPDPGLRMDPPADKKDQVQCTFDHIWNSTEGQGIGIFDLIFWI